MAVKTVPGGKLAEGLVSNVIDNRGLSGLDGAYLGDLAGQAALLGKDLAVAAVPGGQIAESLVSNVIDNRGLSGLDQVAKQQIGNQWSGLTKNPLDFGVDMAL